MESMVRKQRKREEIGSRYGSRDVDSDYDKVIENVTIVFNETVTDLFLYDDEMAMNETEILDEDTIIIDHVIIKNEDLERDFEEYELKQYRHWIRVGVVIFLVSNLFIGICVCLY